MLQCEGKYHSDATQSYDCCVPSGNPSLLSSFKRKSSHLSAIPSPSTSLQQHYKPEIRIVWPVFGFRPSRAALSFESKVPKPTRETCGPREMNETYAPNWKSGVLRWARQQSDAPHNTRLGKSKNVIVRLENGEEIRGS